MIDLYNGSRLNGNAKTVRSSPRNTANEGVSSKSHDGTLQVEAAVESQGTGSDPAKSAIFLHRNAIGVQSTRGKTVTGRDFAS